MWHEKVDVAHMMCQFIFYFFKKQESGEGNKWNNHCY